ncbi:TPA: rfbP protein, partial [Vibrio cholerae]|nr:rfbP protein [Vibrio cholerae]MVE82246.1 rfbP protein [Vibrio cholerae]HAS7021152.1 rfbP protein [Vibrio cholerae]HAS7051549.1 rfbP protein [Vibrio cholerae]HAS7078057.1 rfbP protein [Vibrio cholerae]
MKEKKAAYSRSFIVIPKPPLLAVV